MFHIEREVLDFVVLTRVFGEVDLNAMDDLRQAVDTALALATAPFPVIIDLERVTFLSSTGLGELVLATRRARELGCELRLVATGRAVARPIEVTGLDAELDVRPTLADALAPRAAVL
ncbi:anti-sigma factor antagonist [Actinophytocola xanthii]|uniref:anti-sigma factor antagonist n=1 Tax=Actinophytocola xanthii TaxID=1912961 RepID=UPI0013013FE1|nr:anti-sigma factor antagonist [Actinophytocola xanthii]